MRENICLNMGREYGQWSLERKGVTCHWRKVKRAQTTIEGRGVHTCTFKRGCGTPIMHWCTHMCRHCLCGAAALLPKSMLVIAGGERVSAHEAGW